MTYSESAAATRMQTVSSEPAGSMDLTDEQARKQREYLLPGGFLLCDSFDGTAEWEGFVAGIRRVQKMFG